MDTKVVRIDEEVWAELQRLARPFVDTPNTVLRRVLGLQTEKQANVGYVDARVIKLIDLLEPPTRDYSSQRRTGTGSFPILSKGGKVFGYIYPQKKRLKVEVRKDWAERLGLNDWNLELRKGWFNTDIASVYWYVPTEDTESYRRVSLMLNRLIKLDDQ